MHPFPIDAGFERLRDAVVAGAVTPPPRAARIPRHVTRAILRALSADPSARFADMQALLDALGRDPRRRWALALAGVAVVAAGALALGLDDGASERLAACVRGDGRGEALWDAARRATVGAAFERASPALAGGALARVDAQLTRLGEELRAARAEACAATAVRGEQSEALRDRRLACLDERLQDAWALVERFAEADATTVERAVQAVSRLPPLSSCADRTRLLDRLALPSDPAERARIVAARGEVARLVSLTEAGRFVEGRARAPAVVLQALLPGWPPLEAEAQLALGRLTLDAGDPRGAEGPLHAAITAAVRAGRDDLAASAWLVLALVPGSASADKLDDILRWIEVARAHLAHGGAPPLLEAQLLMTRSQVQTRAWKAAGARPDGEAALALFERELGPDHPRVAQAALVLQLALMHLGEHAQAIALGRRAEAILRRAYGDEHPQVATPLMHIAIVQRMLGKNADALREAQAALAIQERALGPDHRVVGETLHTVADLLSATGSNGEALVLIRRVLKIRQAALGPDHLDLFNTTLMAAPVAVDAGEAEAAIDFVARARALLEANGVAPTESRWATLHLNRAIVAERLGRYVEADEAFQAAGAIYAATDTLPGDLAQCRAAHARQLLRLGRAAEAVPLLREALAVEEKTYGADNPGLADSLLPLAQALLALGESKEAVVAARRALGNLVGEGLDPLLVADVKSAVAQVLDADPATRAEAAELMASARAVAATRPFVWQPIVDRLEAWSRSHPRESPAPR